MHRQNKEDPFFYTDEPQKWFRPDSFTDGCLLCHICFPLDVSWGFSPSSSHVSLFLKDLARMLLQGTSYIFIPTAQSAIDFGSITGGIRKNNKNGERKLPLKFPHFYCPESWTQDTHWRGSQETQSPSLVCVKRLQRCMGAWEGGAAQELVLSPSFCYLAIETQTLLLQV